MDQFHCAGRNLADWPSGVSGFLRLAKREGSFIVPLRLAKPWPSS
ncbi:MAG: hypothetical protein OXS32_13590 [Verrucomicrobiales bacterium]|nr:hypothetical protein [Verrucomicrobiales bacterium]